MKRFAALFIFFAAAALFPAGNGEDGGKDDKTVIVRGTVRLVGNMPFPELVISDAEKNTWYIEDAEKEKLKGYEMRQAVVRAKVRTQEMVLANNKKIGERRILYDIEILPREEN